MTASGLGVASRAKRGAVAHTTAEQALYEVRQKIYPRAVSGKIANWRVAMVLLTQATFYGLPWLPWNGRQAVLFDLVSRKFYIFGLVFLPQDFIFLTALLVISALSLFLFTAVAGRLWCGYACPQTVYTELFLWIERKIEGDRMRRMKLDKQPYGARKVGIKAAKHGAWIAVALWTGFTFVGYFTPISALGSAVVALSTGPWETFWILFYGFATYGNAGFMREQVCKYMCPYARFQSAMFDSDTLVISYDGKRGEPRGPRAKSADTTTRPLGDCVDCSICVQVCPTGIDIRDGLQYECIACGACIDGCNQVMDKMGYPSGLIRYTTQNALTGKYPERRTLAHLFRPRILLYTAVLWALIFAMGVALFLRSPVRLDAIRDRGLLSRPIANGQVENLYRLQILNTEEQAHEFLVSVREAGGTTLELVSETNPIEIPATQTRLVAVRVIGDPTRLAKGANKIEFRVVAADDTKVSARAQSSFFVR
jgi:cytochrome c oxidase accessory protein FixG